MPSENKERPPARPSPARRRWVCALLSERAASMRHVFEGFCDWGRKEGWIVERYDGTGESPSFSSLEDFACFDGFLVASEGLYERFPLLTLGRPLVWCYPPPAMRPLVPGILTDSQAIAQMAATELFSLGLRAYAFIPAAISAGCFSDERREAFLATVRAAGGDARAYLDNRDLDWNVSIRLLADWLSGLPRPFGAFAANDLAAKRCLEACHAAGLAIPGDAYVLGCDDNAPICENTQPRLSSIRLDFRQTGRYAGKMLSRLFAGDTPPLPWCELHGPVAVVTRETTRPATGISDWRVAGALAFIRSHVADGIRTPDVCRHLGMSRRSLENAFRAAGMTIHGAITDARLDLVRSELVGSGKPIGRIAEECGFSSDNYLHSLFRARFHTTMGAYRRESRTDGEAR